MRNKNEVNNYDDDNIPEIDLPQSNNTNKDMDTIVKPLPESTRPRKDGPGGE